MSWNIHKSYAHIHNIESNERLEFLGDSLINFFIAKYVYRNFDYDEGKMTLFKINSVKNSSLAKLAAVDGIYQEIKVHRVEITPSILADALEAKIAYIYEKKGMQVSYDYFIQLFEKQEISIDKDPKTIINELCGKYKLTFKYKNHTTIGPDNNAIHGIDIYINDHHYAHGKGKSIKEAQQEAAKIAIDLIGTRE